MAIGVLILAYLFFGMLSFIAFTSARKMWYYASIIFGIGIWTVHGFLIVRRGVMAGRLPWTNTYETLILLGCLMMAVYFLILIRYRVFALGGFVGITIAFLLALTSLLSPEIEPLLPALKSNWLLFHVTAAFIGYAAFAVAFGSALLFLLIDLFAKRIFPKQMKMENIQVTLTYLDWLTYRLIAVGFPFLTLGIATGAIWANASWGRYWNWDPKETCAFVTWLIYVICLHVRNVNELQGKPAALLAVFGFLAVMFTYFGVNFWLSSLHAYA